MKITNIEDLRSRLLTAFERLEADSGYAQQAKELANVSGKIIGTIRVEMEYALLHKQAPMIPFIGLPKAALETPRSPKQIKSQK